MRRTENRRSCCTASYGLGPSGFFLIFWISTQETNIFLVGTGQQRLAPNCSQVCWESGRCSVSGEKHVHPKASASRSESCSSRDLARPHRLSFALAMVLTMNERRFQRTHLLGGTGFSLNASKADCVGVIDLTPIQNW